MKLETVVMDNGRGGTVICTEEDSVVSGEVVLMQRIYSNIDGYLVEETRLAKLVEDLGYIVLHEFTPGRVLSGNIVMKQRISYAPGYSKMKGYNGKLLRDTEGNLIWGRTYYTEDEEDKDDIVDPKSV